MGLISLSFFLLIGCQISRKPDLGRLYIDHANDQSNTPLIIIHGTMGSKLRDRETQEEFWIGNLKKLAFSNYRDLALEIDTETLTNKPDELEPYEILDSVSGMKIYEDLINILTKYGGYQLNLTASTKQPGRNLYIFTYDWRQDNVASAQQLASFISQVRANNENKQVDIVAHSMGGLISRYYFRYGGQDVLEKKTFIPNSQDHNVRHAIFLGTPNLGSVLSVNRFVNGFQFNVRTIPIEVLITLPSVYQLLPFDQDPWLYNTLGEAVDLNLYDIATWQMYQWGVYNLEVQQQINKYHPGELDTYISFFNKQLQRAEKFWQALSVSQKEPFQKFVVLGGDCQSTTDNLILEYVNSQVMLHAKPNQIVNPSPEIDYRLLMMSPGDGHVTKSSLLGRTQSESFNIPIKYPILLCEDHLKLTKNINFQDNLLHILLQ